MNNLTDAQVYTLRRIRSGTEYLLRGDAKKSHERRQEGRFGFNPVNAPSIPVLYRHGLIEFSLPKKVISNTQYYHIRLTDAGKEALKSIKPLAERGR